MRFLFVVTFIGIFIWLGKKTSDDAKQWQCQQSINRIKERRKKRMTTPKSRKMRERSCAGCGTVAMVRADSPAERCKSCSAKEQQKDKGHSAEHKGRPVHGMRRTREYTVWRNMKARCKNERRKEYRNYGAKGITVCTRWDQSFKAFIDDMGRRPSDDHELHRINSSEGYYPGNCEWIDRIAHRELHGHI